MHRKWLLQTKLLKILGLGPKCKTTDLRAHLFGYRVWRLDVLSCIDFLLGLGFEVVTGLDFAVESSRTIKQLSRKRHNFWSLIRR